MAIAVALVSACLKAGAEGAWRPANVPAPPFARRPQQQVCVVQGDSLRLLPATHSLGSGDTLVSGVAFRRAYPETYPPYIERAAWYQAHQPIQYGGRRYVANHPPQTISPELLRFISRYEGVPVFRAADDRSTPPLYIYLPVRPGCVFQPFTAASSY